MHGDDEQVLLTVKEAASLARRSRSQIYAKLKAGELPAVRSLGGVLIHRARFLELLEREAASARAARSPESEHPEIDGRIRAANERRRE